MPPNCAEAWTRLRGLARTSWLILFGGLPIAFFLSFPSLKRFEAAFLVTWFLAIGVATRRYNAFRCPRCDKRFFQPNAWVRNPFLKACPHCGLPKGATTDDVSSNNRWRGPSTAGRHARRDGTQPSC